ncbi:MAG: O-antigen ligase family protein [Planctomycetota bacterium]|jgi:O-antigen ligase
MTTSGAARRGAVGSWELPLLLLAGAALALPDVFSMDAFKTGALGLLAAAVLLPRLLLEGPRSLKDAVACPGGLLYLAAAAWALPASLGVLHHAAVTDRIVDVLLALTAAALGIAARRADPGILARAMCWVTLLTAVSALLQAVGADTLFTTGPEEVVALMGNSTRAGALLALGLPAALAALVAADDSEPHWRSRLASGALLLGITALLLTRARGGWLAAALGLAVTAFVLRRELAARVRTWLVPVVAGVALAPVLAPTPGALLQSKLDEGAPVLSAGDTTLNVRLAVWSGTLRMVADHPALGAGLGRYRERFPPYRDPDEAALPGLAGARTEVDHPHDEFLLAFAEGGVPSGLCLLGFLVWTLLRARHSRQTGSHGARAGALGMLVAGACAALVQDAWTSPGTALPFFAAVGWLWTPIASRPAPARTPAAVWLAGIAVIAILFALALPRVRVQWGLRRFLLRAQAEDVTLENFPLLVEAADADPGDLDAQRILSAYGSVLEQFHPRADASVSEAVQRARQRIDDLAPHAP